MKKKKQNKNESTIFPFDIAVVRTEGKNSKAQHDSGNQRDRKLKRCSIRSMILGPSWGHISFQAESHCNAHYVFSANFPRCYRRRLSYGLINYPRTCIVINND